MLLPIMKRLKEQGLEIEAVLHPFIIKNSPRVIKTLEANNIPIKHLTWEPRPIIAYMFGASALITAADTTAGPHRPGHKLTKLANYLGLQTYTLQHGLENIGLTYFDEHFKPETVDFASKTIFTWCSEEQLDARVSQKIKKRCVAMGCPKDYRDEDVPNVTLPFSYDRLVVVFENLHWDRFSDDFRSRFLSDLEFAAQSNPEVTFLLKPHHAGRWTTKTNPNRFDHCNNIIVAHPSDPQWEPYTGPSLIKSADAIITTPSTIAFDAAVMTKPLSVVGYDLNLPIYSPLPILRSKDSWNQFIKSVYNAEVRQKLMVQAREFRDRASLPRPAATEIAKHIIKHI